jgi:hypothetical protein
MAMLAAVLSTFAPRVSSAQEAPPPLAPLSQPPASVPETLVSDAVFAAVRGREVVLTMRTGSTVAALILSSDGDTLILALLPSGQISGVPKASVFDVRVILPNRQPEPHYRPEYREREQLAPPAPTLVPPSKRYFGLQLGLPPAVMIDFDYGHFIAFANVSVFMPLLTQSTTEDFNEPFGGIGTAHLWAFTIGTGVTFRFSPYSRWHFDLFATGGGTNWDPGNNYAEPYAAFGLGFGFHVTLDGGFTFAIKAPLVGGATSSDSINGGSTALLANYFLSSLVGLPLVSFGYRF